MRNKLYALAIVSTLLGSYIWAAGITATSVRTVYQSTPVGTSTPVVIVTALPSPVAYVSIFDSSGLTMELQIAPKGGTTTYVLIPPGGASFPLKISAEAEISLLGISGTANASGTENDTTFFY